MHLVQYNTNCDKKKHGIYDEAYGGPRAIKATHVEKQGGGMPQNIK